MLHFFWPLVIRAIALIWEPLTCVIHRAAPKQYGSPQINGSPCAIVPLWKLGWLSHFWSAKTSLWMHLMFVHHPSTKWIRTATQDYWPHPISIFVPPPSQCCAHPKSHSCDNACLSVMVLYYLSCQWLHLPFPTTFCVYNITALNTNKIFLQLVRPIIPALYAISLIFFQVRCVRRWSGRIQKPWSLRSTCRFLIYLVQRLKKTWKSQEKLRY